MPRELKEVIKVKLRGNEMWFRICKVLFRQKISCAKKIAEEIGCDSEKVSSQLRTLEDSKIIESTGRIRRNHLADRHRKGNYSKFYLLTETAGEAMREILKE